MASIITATTTSGLTQSADNSGVLQLASGTGNLVTVPAVTGTAMVSGNMPTFSAYASGGQTLNSGTETKLQFNNEDWDTASCYNTSTYRFTPNVAGYYQITVGFSTSSATVQTEPIIYKNGAVWMYGTYPITATAQTSWNYLTGLVYCNGSTDYIEAYAFVNATVTTQTNSLYKFQGVLVRSA
jgi:hypothetical protein